MWERDLWGGWQIGRKVRCEDKSNKKCPICMDKIVEQVYYKNPCFIRNYNPLMLLTKYLTT